MPTTPPWAPLRPMKPSAMAARLFVDRTPTWETPRVANVQPATRGIDPKEVPRKWKSGLKEMPARLIGHSRHSAWQITPRVAEPARTQNWAPVTSPAGMPPSGAPPQITRNRPRPAMPTTLLTTGAHM